MKLVNAGCTSIKDMRKPEYFDMLTPAQKVGLMYIDHLDMPVTREQSESVAVRLSPCPFSRTER